MSTAFPGLTIANCMRLIAAEFGAEPNWQPANENQEKLLAILPQLQKAALAAGVEGIADKSAAVINDWLRQKGFDIQLTEWPSNPAYFGVASVLENYFKWQYQGNLTDAKGSKISVNGRQGFRMDLALFIGMNADMKVGNNCIGCSILDEPVFVFPTENSDIVYMVKHPEVLDEFSLYEKVIAIRENLIWGYRARGGYNLQAVDLPFVSFDIQPDISWLVEMQSIDEFGGMDLQIVQALAQVKFGMNQLGMIAKEAAAIAVFRGGGPSLIYKMDENFLVWTESGQHEPPVFVAQVTTDDFQESVDLESI